MSAELFAPRRAKHRRTWTLAAIPLVLVFIVLGQIIGVIPGVMLGLVSDDMSGGWEETAYILFAAFAAGALLLFLWVWLFERRGLGTLGLNGHFLWPFLRGYGLGLAFLCAVVGIIFLIGGYELEAPGTLNAAVLAPLGILLLGFIVQGSTEEIFFRGWLMQLVTSRHGILLGALVNSVLFGLVHALNIPFGPALALGLVNIVLVGLFLSLYAAKEGTLWGVCAWHAAWNWLLGTGFGLPVSGMELGVPALVADLADPGALPWWVTGGEFGPEASVVCTGVLALGTLVLAVRGTVRDFGTADVAPGSSA